MTYFAFEDLAITRMISILLDNSDGLGQSVWCGVVKKLTYNTRTSSFGSKKIPLGQKFILSTCTALPGRAVHAVWTISVMFRPFLIP